MQEQMTQLMSQFLPNTAPHHQPSTQNRCSRPTRPTITADCTDNKWVIFADAWRRYKEMTKLVDPQEIRNELRSACDLAVNEMLFNFVGPNALHTSTEEELLAHIKSVAVKTVHPEVYRQQFFSMRQSDGESITRFISRLKSQAMLCDFVRKCDCPNDTCRTSYSEDMIMSQVITGLYNSSHQNRVLSEMSTIRTLPQMTERLLTLESTAQATNHFKPDFSDTSSADVNAVRSQYQRNKYKDSRPKPPALSTQLKTQPQQDKCRGCGRNRHTKGRDQCPAQGQTCNNCGKLNHFANVCMSSKTNAVQENEVNDTSFISSVTTPVL